MERTSIRPVPIWLLITLLLYDAVNSASTYDNTIHIRAHSTNVDETTALLLAHRDDPLAENDKWSSLSRSQRQKWTQANNVVYPLHNVSDLLETTKRLRKSCIAIHIDVQIVDPEHIITPEQYNQILRYTAGMRAGRNGTCLNFTVSAAPEQISRRVALHLPVQNDAELAMLLAQSAHALGTLNVLYAIIYRLGARSPQYASATPKLGTSWTAYFVYSVDDPRHIIVTDLLITIERIAEQVFAPQSLYFPIPLTPHLHVSVTAFTPGYERRATWLDDFVWDEFEIAVCTYAIPGQKVRFSSSQSNGECDVCRQAFHDAARPPLTFIRNAVTTLCQGNAPNHTWIDGIASRTARKRILPNTFRLFVLDTSNVKQTNAVQRLERRALFVFPGIAVLVVRSSDRNVELFLHSFMLRAVIAGVYGVVDPALYVPRRKSLSHTVAWPGRPSPVLRDIITRNVVRSIIERRLVQLEEIVDGMVHFKVEPTETLDDYEYIHFVQRVNLLLYKLEKAQQVISRTHDGELAIYLMSSTAHDMKAIRAAFNIDDGNRALKRIKDPTIRRRMSRLKREALRASEIFETTHPFALRVLFALSSFIISVLITRAVIWKVSKKKSRKLE